MKFIEKKCPNCGADLKFKIGDKEVKCNYCNSEFIIEDNNKDEKNINIDDINLCKKAIKFFSAFHIIITSIILIFTIGFFIFTASRVNGNIFNFNDTKISINEINNETKNDLYEASVSEYGNWDIMHSKYHLKGDYEDYGYYYLKNKTNVKVIYVLKSTYESDDDTKTIYTAFKFTGSSIDKLSYKPYIDANSKKLSTFDYVYGYDSIKKLYKSCVANELSFGYKIVASKNLYID